MNSRRGSPFEIAAVVVALVLICGLGAVLLGQLGRRSAPPAVAVAPTPAPAPTTPPPTSAPAPTFTSEPTEIPAPTETAALIDEPAPTEAPAAGLGVTRAQLQEVYTRAGFTFDEPSELATGEPRVIGEAPNRSIIELIGPADDIVRASVIVPVPRDDQAGREVSAVYITGLIQQVAPEHLQEISAWLGERLGDQEDGDLVTGVYRSKVTVIPVDDGMVVSYTIASAQR